LLENDNQPLHRIGQAARRFQNTPPIFSVAMLTRFIESRVDHLVGNDCFRNAALSSNLGIILLPGAAEQIRMVGVRGQALRQT
jgi:hypothetical protein